MPLRSYFLMVEIKRVSRYTKWDPKKGKKCPDPLISCHNFLRNTPTMDFNYNHDIIFRSYPWPPHLLFTKTSHLPDMCKITMLTMEDLKKVVGLTPQAQRQHLYDPLFNFPVQLYGVLKPSISLVAVLKWNLAKLWPLLNHPVKLPDMWNPITQLWVV